MTSIEFILKDQTNVRCKDNEELCPEGNCAQKCDGKYDCSNGIDELNCNGFVTPSSVSVLNEPIIPVINTSIADTEKG